MKFDIPSFPSGGDDGIRRGFTPLGWGEAGPSFVPEDVSQAEANALIALYKATDGDNWTDNTGWLTDPVVGNWFGITVIGGEVVTIDLDSNNLNGAVTIDFEALQYLTVVTFISNTSLNVQNTLDSLPDGIITFHVLNTASTMVGATADLPNSLQFAFLGQNNNTIDFSLDTLPTSLKRLYLYLTNTTVLPASGPTSAPNIDASGIRLDDLGLTTSQVDGLLERLYTDRAIFTNASPGLDISGDNAVPSGFYQDGDPPTTGREFLYELENDPEAEGFNTWNITPASDTAWPQTANLHVLYQKCSGTQFVDSSGNGNDGVFDVAPYEPHCVGGETYFDGGGDFGGSGVDGNPSVVVFPRVPPSAPNAHTVIFSFAMDGSALFSGQTIFSYLFGGTSHFSPLLFVENNQEWFYYATTNLCFNFSESAAIPDNVRVTRALTNSGSEVNFYDELGNVLTTSTSNPSPRTDSGSDAWLGAYAFFGNRRDPLGGTMHSFVIYTDVLTGTDLTDALELASL